MHRFGALLMLPSNSFGINTCKSVSKQRTLSPSRMNTYAKTGEGGPPTQGSPRAAQESKFWMSPLSVRQYTTSASGRSCQVENNSRSTDASTMRKFCPESTRQKVASDETFRQVLRL